jgi:hypothetical protein
MSPLNFSGIYTYMNYLQKQDVKRNWKDQQVDLRGYSNADIAGRELELFEEAYGNIPTVFVLVPQDINIGQNGVRYLDSDNYMMIVNFITHRHPNWTVVYPVKEFNQLLADGYAPKGFDNSKPFVGHMNVCGHKILGEILARTLSALLQ